MQLAVPIPILFGSKDDRLFQSTKLMATMALASGQLIRGQRRLRETQIEGVVLFVTAVSADHCGSGLPSTA